MGDSSSNHPTPSRMRLRNAGGGEIVEVQGGHIVRSIGRKDRHSKVCTAKGPRDRRVRLAAHTAIQFYDVQDRLGYDRPSKAVDWLINKAKAAIDELAHLPPWHPTLCSEQPKQLDEEQQQHQFVIDHSDSVNANPSEQNADVAQSSSFVPTSLDSDAIADTIKSFFPTSGASSAGASSSAMQFSDLLSRNGSNSQDLRLSLQSFQDPILLHHHNRQSQSQSYSEAQALLSATPLGFESWAEHHHQQVAELSRLQRLPPWDSAANSGGAGYLQQLLGQNQFVSQRGPLQSSNTPSIRAWMDPSAIAIAAADHHRPAIVPIYPSSMAGIGFTSGVAGFHIPTRIQGDEEHGSYSDKPSSASRH